MLQRVQFADHIEPLVQFIEETPPSEIVDRTLEKLRAGVPIKTMMTASALAVTRSADLPPGHHGGPLHPAGRHVRDPEAGRPPGRRGPFHSCPATRRAGQQAHQRPGDRAVPVAGIRAVGCRRRRDDRRGRPGPGRLRRRDRAGVASKRPRKPSSSPSAAARATRRTTTSSGCGRTSRRWRRSIC